jgi:hypothetical protein
MGSSLTENDSRPLSPFHQEIPSRVLTVFGEVARSETGRIGETATADTAFVKSPWLPLTTGSRSGTLWVIMRDWAG